MSVTSTHSSELYPGQPAGLGLDLLVVRNDLASAVLSVQGAQLLSYRPAGGPDLLWLSPLARFAPGAEIRGGVPICAPWFGVAGPDLPEGLGRHGYARTATWSVQEVAEVPGGGTRLVLSLPGRGGTVPAAWPYDLSMQLEVTIGAQCGLSLAVTTAGGDPVPFSFAFHTYLAVPDVSGARVTGLAGCRYRDAETGAISRQEGDVRIDGFTDRVYLDVPREQTVVSAAGTTRIASDAPSCVVWHPWERAADMVDVRSHSDFLCVERGEVAADARPLAPGETRVRTVVLMPGDDR